MMSSSNSGPAATIERGLADEVLMQIRPAPLWDFLGCELLDAMPGTSTVRLPARRQHDLSSNSGDGAARGGVLATLADMAANCALMTVLRPHERCMTIDFIVHHLAPACGDLLATGTVRRRDGRTVVIDVEITTGDNEEVAFGRATFAMLRRG